MNKKIIARWFISYGLQGIALSSLMVVISLFAVTGLYGNVRSATTAAALYSTGTLIGSLITGNILDKKSIYDKIVFVGLIGGSIATAVMPFSVNLQMYYMTVFAFGFAISMVNPAITLYLSRKSNEESYRKFINEMNLLNSIGITLGTFLGGAVLSFIPLTGEANKMRFVFLIAALIFSIGAVISSDISVAKEEVKKKKQKRFTVSIRPVFANLRLIPRNFPRRIDFSIYGKEVKLYLAGIFVAFFGANLFFAPFPVFMKQVLNISSEKIFLIYTYANIAATGAYFFTRYAMENFRDFSIMRTVFWIRIFGFLGIIVFGLTYNYYGIMLTFILINFTWPFLYITSTIQATKLASEDNKGKVLGAFNMVISFAVIAASFLSGMIALKFGYYFAFALGAVLLFVGERITNRVAKIVPVPQEVVEKVIQRKQKRKTKFMKILKGGVR